MRFNDTYNEALGIILEGGNAVPGVDRIKLQYIEGTILSFKDTVLDKLDENCVYFTLGSTGKKKDSGDIDIGIDMNSLQEKNKIINLIKLNEICARAGYNSCINTISYDMLHVAYPQVGNRGKNVQIDVILTENPVFTKFYMNYPGEDQTRYKTAHRNSLLNAILLGISFLPFVKDEAGEVVKWSQLAMTQYGIFKQYKTLVDMNGKRLHYKDTDEDLLFIYAKTESEILFSDKVQFAINYTVGEGYTAEDIDTFEKLFSIVKNDPKFRYAGIKDRILKNCANDLKDAETRHLEFPAELNDYK